MGEGRVAGPLSSAQQALWLADRVLPGGAHYHLGWMIDLDGALAVAALRAALEEIVARHESLRLSVGEAGGRSVLLVAPPARIALPVADVAELAADALARAALVRPFEPDRGPLWRIELYRLAPRRHRLVLVLHHLIADPATVALLLADLAAGYRARHGGQAPELPPATPYSDYLAWEREFLDSPQCAAQVAYWTEQVGGAPALELPTDRPRLPASRRPGAVLPLAIAAPTADALRELARSHGATLVQALLACYATVLHRYAGRSELIVGMPVSVRRGPRWAASAGLYVNTLPIRIGMAGNPPFAQLLAQVRGTVFTAIGASEVPLATVAAEIRAGHPAGAGRLYDVTFGLAQGPRLALDLPGIRTRVTGMYGGQAKFDLHLEIINGGAGTSLHGLLEYDTDLFDAATAQRLADSFVTIATGAAETPGRSIGNLPLYTDAIPAPDHQAAPHFVAQPVAHPAPQPAAQPGGGRADILFARAAAATPVKVALVDAADGRELTYAELAARARAVAAALAARGVGRGDFVGITLARSADMVVAILGVLTAGAAYVPLDAGYPVRRLTEMIDKSGVRLVIGSAPAGLRVPVIDLPRDDGPAAGQPATEAGLGDPDLWGADLGGAGLGGADPDGAGLWGGCAEDPAYVMFTSGSTGTPKAVVVPHRGIVRLVRGTDFATMTAAERWLHCASPSFDASTLELWAPLLNGGTVIVLPGMPTVAELRAVIKRHQVTSAFLTTGLFNLVVDTDLQALRPLSQLVIGGEAASAAHLRRALAVLPSVVNGYGPTENTTFTSCYTVREPAEVTSPVPIGTPIAGTSAHIVDAYVNAMPPGAVGEILAGGRGLAIGYAGDPGLTAERFVPSPFGPPGARLYRTGDYGRLGPDGVLHFVGRLDDQVKVRGFRIELGAIEHALLTHPAVGQAAVVVRTDPTGDRRLVGYTVGAARPAELATYLRSLLPAYMIPGQWIALDALPLGPTGKVDRNALPEPAAESARPARARTVVQELIVAWYTELLGLADVTLETDFFAVGGHSLFAARLASRIRAVFAVDLPLRAVFANPRLADLAALVMAEQRSDAPPLRASGCRDDMALSFAQEQTWTWYRGAADVARYHLLARIDLRGELDRAALASALQSAADRHPALRTVVSADDGRPSQAVRPAGTPLRPDEVDLAGVGEDRRPEALSDVTATLLAARFDLSAELPIRALLVRLGASAHRLLLVVHQIAADSDSMRLICADIVRGYADPLPPTGEVTYPDYAAWQRTVLAGESGQRLESYWRDRLAGSPGTPGLLGDLPALLGDLPALPGDLPALPGDLPALPGLPRTVPDQVAGGGECDRVQPISLPADVADGIREVARTVHATHFAALLAGLAAALARLSGQSDVIISVAVVNRTEAAVTDMVGPFVNTLPVRVDASADLSFAALVRQSGQSLVRALEHGALPAERIAQLASPAPAARPPATVLLTVRDAAPGWFAAGGVQADVLPVRQGMAMADVAVSLTDDGAGLTGYLEGRGALGSTGLVAALAREFLSLLAAVASSPDQPMGTLGVDHQDKQRDRKEHLSGR